MRAEIAKPLRGTLFKPRHHQLELLRWYILLQVHFALRSVNVCLGSVVNLEVAFVIVWRHMEKNVNIGGFHEANKKKGIEG